MIWMKMKGREKSKVTWLLIANTVFFNSLSHFYLQEETKAKKIKDNSPSKPKEMPEDFIPLHFTSWLKNGPASDSQHPLSIPDTGKVVMKQKADILDSNDTVSGNGKMSKYSLKAQRMEVTRKNGDGNVVDFTVGEDANSGLLRESIKNSAMIVSILQGVTDQERKNTDALCLMLQRCMS